MPKEIPTKPPKTHLNPLAVALRYKRLLETPGIGAQANLARAVGVSHARGNQILRLPKLPLAIQQSVIKMGAPLPSPERKLRALLVLPLPK